MKTPKESTDQEMDSGVSYLETKMYWVLGFFLLSFVLFSATKLIVQTIVAP